MSDPAVAPYGEWASPISAADVAAARIRVGFPVRFAGETYWQETPPDGGGRTTVVRRATDGTCAPVIPPGYEARTRVHEYGGRSYHLVPTPPGEWAVVFANYGDQRLYLVRSTDPASPMPLTPQSEDEAGLRYADFTSSPDGAELWCVREAHERDRPPERAIVAVPLDGSAAEDRGAVRELVTDGDFLAFPTPSPDGIHLAWISWNRPNMPWEASELRVGRIDGSGPVEGRPLMGGPTESVLAPVWRDRDSLYAVSDRSGWWNVHLIDLAGQVSNVCPVEEEFAEPLWSLGGRPFALRPDGKLVVLHGTGALRLAVLDPRNGRLEDVPSPYTAFAPTLSVEGDSLCGVAQKTHSPGGVVVMDLAHGLQELVRAETDASPPAAYLPAVEAVEFTHAGGESVHAFRYPPTNPDFRGPDDELPPYVVWAHGGPTGHVTDAFDIAKAYFTSRGIGVLDVNYGGSSGYGRAYRGRLRGNWGVTDAADVAAAARLLVARGLADGRRLAVRGASAGGWTALVAVTSGTGRLGAVFAAATSYFGVTDASLLAAHTHDFEAGCFDWLLGPLPKSAYLYRERSPLGHVNSSTCPVLLLQGLEDPVVPPSQSQLLIDELVEHGIEHSYVAFEQESHGFRRPETVRACFEAELAFYGRVLGFTPSRHSNSHQRQLKV
ncbi:S9 family peptidase [Saccharothrix saharensis]|uniref:S9 family peptidase n=1 Tax=Saccharothrix saharensis TaxID=571190 RepID=UPI0036912B21